LTDNEYEQLIKNVSTVFNAAASVKHYGSYKYFYETNVETVKNLIEFCKKADAKLIHTSTLSVSGNSFGDEFDGYISETEKHFYESSLYIEQPLENVYARSKFEAEKTILEEMANGLKANIMRMGNLTNRFSDAKFQKNHESNAFLNRLRAVLNLGIFPEYLMDLYLEFTPIDDAASAVMTIARNFSTEQTVFHIIAPMIRGRLSVMATEDEQYQQKEFEYVIKSNPECNLFITPAKLKQFIYNREVFSLFDQKYFDL